MSDIQSLKQQNAELQVQLRSYKDALACIKDHVNDVEWQCKFATDKVAALLAEKEELLALIASKEAALALGESALLAAMAKLWCYENNYGELAGYVDANSPELVIAVLEDPAFKDAAADLAMNSIRMEETR